MFHGEEQLCIPLEPLRRTNARVVLGPGEKVFVPFLVMVDDECSFIFDQIGEYEVRAYVVDRWGEIGAEIENSEKVLVSVYDWELEDEWAESAFGCTPLNAFGLGLSLEKLGAFSETAPYLDIFPFILGGGRTVTAMWRGDQIFLSETFQSKEASWKEGSVGWVMWKNFILFDERYSGSRVFGNGDYILDM